MAQHRFLEAFDRILTLGLKASSVICLVGLLSMISAMIFVRFVPVSSMGWADEIVELAFVYMVFLGSAVLWKERSHFRVDMIPLWLGGTRAGTFLKVFLNILSLAFFLVFTYQGVILTLRTTDNSPILDLPKLLWYGVLPISGGVFIGYTIRDLWLLFRGRPLP
ncbi:MAG: TRAP transporter small permease subunit [Deltaproteobacteria bacterium]|jgi:TRAP-type C4-dicarboxylate transport system permease small subunit|nr:TRAP transporter small permease subunit [Deltaproteobacteria bacterium]